MRRKKDRGNGKGMDVTHSMLSPIPYPLPPSPCFGSVLYPSTTYPLLSGRRDVIHPAPAPSYPTAPLRNAGAPLSQTNLPIPLRGFRCLPPAVRETPAEVPRFPPRCAGFPGVSRHRRISGDSRPNSRGSRRTSRDSRPHSGGSTGSFRGSRRTSRDARRTSRGGNS